MSCTSAALRGTAVAACGSAFIPADGAPSGTAFVLGWAMLGSVVCEAIW